MWAVVLLLSESRTIINDLDVILHGFLLQIIYTTVFRVKQLNNRTRINITYVGRSRVRFKNTDNLPRVEKYLKIA